MRVETNKERIIPVVNSTSGISDKPTIHIVHILDGSGSMAGYRGSSKFESAREGMLEEINMLKKDDKVNYLYSIIEFDEPSRIIEVCSRKRISEIEFSKLPFFLPDGCTALYDAIGKTLNTLLVETKDEKVLVKIFTDGGENASQRFNSSSTKELIESCKKLGYVITFIGTEQDVLKIQRNIHIDASNTLSHDNTAKGMRAAYQTVNSATMAYSKCVVDGVDTNTGFFNQEQNKK